MVQYYLDGFWIMLGEEKRDALVAQAKEKAEAKKTKQQILSITKIHGKNKKQKHKKTKT